MEYDLRKMLRNCTKSSDIRQIRDEMLAAYWRIFLPSFGFIHCRDSISHQWCREKETIMKEGSVHIHTYIIKTLCKCAKCLKKCLFSKGVYSIQLIGEVHANGKVQIMVWEDRNDHSPIVFFSVLFPSNLNENDQAHSLNWKQQAYRIKTSSNPWHKYS